MKNKKKGKLHKYVIINHFVTFAGPDDYVEAESPLAAMRWWRERWREEDTIAGFKRCKEGDELFIVRDLKTGEETYYNPVMTEKYKKRSGLE